MRLPPGGLHQLLRRHATRSLQQVENLVGFATWTTGLRFMMIFQLLLDGARPLVCIAFFLGRMHASATYGRLILRIACAGRGAGSGFLLNSCFHIFSFRGDHRGLHMDRSGAPEKQGKSNLGEGMAMAGQCRLTVALMVSHGCLSANLAHLL